MCASNDPRVVDGAPTPKVKIEVNGRSVWALIDIECAQTLVGPAVTTAKVYGFKQIMTVDGRKIVCKGKVSVVLTLAGKTLKVPCIVAQSMEPYVDVIVGSDVLRHFKFSMSYGECSLAATAKVATKTSENLKIAQSNFEVDFDGKMWVAK